MFRIRLNLYPRTAQMTFHTKTPYRRRIVISYPFFLRVETDTLADVVVAGGTPYVVGHFEADDEDALVEFVGATAEGVGAGHFVDVGLAIVVGRVVLVERLHRGTGLVCKADGNVGGVEQLKELKAGNVTLTLSHFCDDLFDRPIVPT